MFSEACKKVRESLYGIMGSSVISQQGPQQKVNFSNGTGFMAELDYIITAAHMVHVENNPNKPIHQLFEVIRAPEVGQKMETAIFVAEDKEKDIALLKIQNPRSRATVRISEIKLSRGENCGFLGFPLANVVFKENGARIFNLFERFQGAYISNYIESPMPSGSVKKLYEIDTLMYSGSSGCPGFTTEGEVVGIQVASIMQNNKDADKIERVAISLVVPSTEILEFLKVQKSQLIAINN